MQLVINFDKAQSRYRSYVAELSVLNAILSNDNFELYDIEYGLPNNKSADYAFNTNKGLQLIEVESFDLLKKRINNEKELDDHINKRILNKLKCKLDGLPKEWKIPFFLIQVLWADFEKLYNFKEYFSKPNIYPNIVLQLMTIAQFFDKEKEIPRYIFLTAEELLKRIHERKNS